MSDIFVSYSSKDRAAVDRLVADLARAGFDVWWDRDLKPGLEFREQLLQRVRSARLVIVCWSAASAESNWVREEAALALDSRTYFPVSLQRCELPAGFRELNAYDLTKWDPFGYDLTAMSGLVQNVAERLNADAADRRKALRRRRFGRGLEIVAFTIFALALIAALVGAAVFGLDALPPDYAPAARIGIGALALATGFWAVGALFGLGLRGNGGLARLAMMGAAAAGAWFAAPMVAPALDPPPLQLLAPDLLEFRHTTYKNAPPELMENAPSQVLLSVGLVRGDRPGKAVARAIRARVSIDGGQFFDLTANHFTQTKEESTLPVPGAPFTPNLAPIAYPQTLDGKPSNEIAFAFERPVVWSAMLDELLHTERSIDVDLSVDLGDGDVRHASCSAEDVAKRRDEVRALLLQQRTPNRITFSCRGG